MRRGKILSKSSNEQGSGPEARWPLVLATIYEGPRRTEAAKVSGLTAQIVRDWVVKLKSNGHGPDGRALASAAVEREVARLSPRSRRPAEARRPPPLEDESREKKIADALSLWAASVDPRGTIVERYLNSRALDICEDIAGTVLRWHPAAGAMLALFRNVRTDAPQAISRTFLDREGGKIERKFLGPVGGAAGQQF